MSKYSYWIRWIVWSFVIYNFASIFGSQLSLATNFTQKEWVLLGAPILEEFLKFVMARSIGKPVIVGLGIQATETITYGLASISKLIASPHWITMLAYERYGIRWRALPIAIGIHFIWNAYWSLEDPADKVPAVALLLVFSIAMFLLRKNLHPVEGGKGD